MNALASLCDWTFVKFSIPVAIKIQSAALWFSKIWGSHLVITALVDFETLCFFFFFLLFDGRWADANGEQVLRSLPPPHEKLTVVSSEWMDCSAPAYPSLCLPFFFFCYLLNASLHISLRCRLYRTLPSHLINHSIELHATQQKPVGSESEVICLPLSSLQVRFSWSRYFAAPVV